MVAASSKRSSYFRLVLVAVATVLAAVLLGLLAQPSQAESPNQQCNVNFQGHFICVDKTTSPNPATVGQQIVFTINVTVPSLPKAVGTYIAGIQDTLPPSFILVSVEASGDESVIPSFCTVTDNTVNCGVLINQENPGTVIIKAVPTQCGDFTNSAFETEEGPTSTVPFTVIGCEDTPQTKAECKNGSYEEFGFKNQGQCIASLQRNAETTQ
jgi:hypothetical protein